MFSHLFKIFANQWRSNLWIMAELLLAFVCIWQVALVLLSLITLKCTPKGFDLEHVYMVSYVMKSKDVPGYDSTSVSADDLRLLVERVRRFSGVEAAGFTTHTAYPYTGSSHGNTYYGDTTTVGCVYGSLTPEVVPVFRLSTHAEGVDLEREARRGDVFLVTPEMMAKLYDEHTTHARIYRFENRDKACTALRSDYRTNEYGMGYGGCGACRFQPEAELLAEGVRLTMFIRVRPEADHDFVDHFFSTMRTQLTSGNVTIVGLTKMTDERHRILGYYGINMRYAVGYFLSAFFLICVFLGIIGTFWFRTESRTSEIGLRMALGSTRSQVRRQMVGEGLLLFAVVWVPGMVLCWLLRNVFSDGIDGMSDVAFYASLSLLSTLVMALLIVAGAWMPARQASRINPVDALRYE